MKDERAELKRYLINWDPTIQQYLDERPEPDAADWIMASAIVGTQPPEEAVAELLRNINDVSSEQLAEAVLSLALGQDAREEPVLKKIISAMVLDQDTEIPKPGEILIEMPDCQITAGGYNPFTKRLDLELVIKQPIELKRITGVYQIQLPETKDAE